MPSDLIASGVVAILFGGLFGWAAIMIWRRPQNSVLLWVAATLLALLGLVSVAFGCLLAGCGLVAR